MSSRPPVAHRARALRACVAALSVAVAGHSVAAQELGSSSYIAPIPLEAVRGVSPEPLSVARDLQRLRAAAAGTRNKAREAEANWLLGLLALHGIAMPHDPVQATSRFERARQLGLGLAAAGLAWCALDGCVGVPQPAAARRSLEALRVTDPGRALYLEWLIDQRVAGLQIASPVAQGAAPPVRVEMDKLARAAHMGDAQALVEMGLALAEQGHLQEALAQFRAAAPHSPAAAANVSLLIAHMQARTEPHGEPSAQQLFEQARRQHRGDGVPVNYVQAIALYREAAEKGSEPARRMLQMILMGRSPDGQISIPWMAQLAQVDTAAAVGGAMLPPAAAPPLRRDPTALYDLLPARWQ